MIGEKSIEMQPSAAVASWTSVVMPRMRMISRIWTWMISAEKTASMTFLEMSAHMQQRMVTHWMERRIRAYHRIEKRRGSTFRAIVFLGERCGINVCKDFVWSLRASPEEDGDEDDSEEEGDNSDGAVVESLGEAHGRGAWVRREDEA